MKLQRFLDCVQTELLNRPEVHIPTLKLFISKFNKCLSKNERERNELQIQMIMEFTKRQTTIDELTQQITLDELQAQLKQQSRMGKPE